MPALTNNQITANGTYQVPTFPGQTYAVGIGGAFGGGTIAVRWHDGTNTGPYATGITAASTFTFVATTTVAELVLTGATAPSLTVAVALGEGSAIGGLSGLGANVATALAKPTGTLGAVQLVGDVQTPSAIQLPDMTGLTAAVGYIGLKNGQLAVADNVTPGGVLVAPRRYAARTYVNFGTQLKSSAFVKLLEIPFTAAEFTVGRRFKLAGWVKIAPAAGSAFNNLTELVFGTSYLAGSTVAYNPAVAASPTHWRALPWTGMPVSFDWQKILKYEIVGNFGQHSIFDSAMEAQLGRGFERTITGILPSIYDVYSGGFPPRPNGTSGVENSLCFMFQLKSSDLGNCTATSPEIEVNYDLTLEFTN